MPMRLLFICNQGENRSRTAEELFNKDYETKSAGIYAIHEGMPLTADLLDWANVVFVMEEHQREFIASNFTKQYICKRILNLEIPDIYKKDQLELVRILRNKVKAWLRKIE